VPKKTGIHKPQKREKHGRTGNEGEGKRKRLTKGGKTSTGEVGAKKGFRHKERGAERIEGFGGEVGVDLQTHGGFRESGGPWGTKKAASALRTVTKRNVLREGAPNAEERGWGSTGKNRAKKPTKRKTLQKGFHLKRMIITFVTKKEDNQKKGKKKKNLKENGPTRARGELEKPNNKEGEGGPHRKIIWGGGKLSWG